MTLPEQDAITVDALVFGAGAGGMTAALVCALEGLNVLLCEKTAQVGGTTATSAGTIWVIGTRQAREMGSADSIDDARRYLDAIIGPSTDNRRDIYLTTGKDVVEYLDSRSEVKFSAYTKHPDYLVNRPGSTLAGRALAPLPFDGRLLGEDFKLLRPPIGEFMALGGMMIGRDDIEPLTRPFGSLASFRKAVSLVWRQALDRLRHPRGTRLLMGNALAARLLMSLKAQQVRIRLERRLAGTDRRGRPRDRRGCHARRQAATHHGAPRRHPRDRRLRRQRRAAQRICETAARRCRGLCRRSRRRHADRARGGRSHRGRSRVSGVLDAGVAHRLAQGRPRRLPASRARPLQARADRGQRRGPALRRRGGVVSRLRSRHASLARERCRPFRPGSSATPRFCDKYGLGRIPPGRESFGWAIGTAISSKRGPPKRWPRRSASMPRASARRSRATTATPTTGEDSDFGKGSTEFDRNNGDPKHGPNPCIGPIATPPYYAMAVYPSTLGSSIGLKPTPTAVCSTRKARRSRACSPAATTWRRSCAALIRPGHHAWTCAGVRLARRDGRGGQEFLSSIRSN